MCVAEPCEAWSGVRVSCSLCRSCARSVKRSLGPIKNSRFNFKNLEMENYYYKSDRFW